MKECCHENSSFCNLDLLLLVAFAAIKIFPCHTRPSIHWNEDVEILPNVRALIGGFVGPVTTSISNKGLIVVGLEPWGALIIDGLGASAEWALTSGGLTAAALVWLRCWRCIERWLTLSKCSRSSNWWWSYCCLSYWSIC